MDKNALTMIGRLIVLCFIILFFLIPVQAIAQSILTITIKELRNSQGHVLLQVFDENQKLIKEASQSIENENCVVRFVNLETGKYAFKYFHDENDDLNLNTNWVGIPKEGFGFSNNAKAIFGPPAFIKWVFEVSGNLEIVSSPQYF